MSVFKYKKTIEDIAEEYDILLFVYFGSYRTEFYNDESDIDIAYLSSCQLSSDKQIKLLEELIKYHRKCEIDLVNLRTAEPLLKHEIAVNGRVFYESEQGLFEKYSLFYIKQYYELKPLINAELKRIAEDIKEVLDND